MPIVAQALLTILFVLTILIIIALDRFGPRIKRWWSEGIERDRKIEAAIRHCRETQEKQEQAFHEAEEEISRMGWEREVQSLFKRKEDK